MLINKIKGTRDIFGKQAQIFNYIKDRFFDCAKRYTYEFIETPIIENVNLFIHSAGETSDIVSKEMYVFKDNNNNEIALRPEATASTIRFYVENKINNFSGDGKFFYFGPMFRYERPQKGRYRQFYQGGIELLAPKTDLSDFEVIKLAYDFLTDIKISDFILEINHLGSFESRNKYINYLKRYFKQYENELSDISKTRIEKNVLRILDDKTENDKDFVKNAPKLWDFLTEQEKLEFNNLLQLLDEFNIKYKINYYLVRGLDYYNDVVFEFVSTSDALGSKSTILAGGRYNGMVEQFGGPKIDSIGFAFGVDRLMEIVEYNIDKYPELNNQVDILIGYMNNAEKDIILKVAYDLRKKYSVMLINRKISLKDFFKKQFFLKPRFIVFKELNSKPNEIKIKNSQNEIITKYTNINDFEKAIKALEKEK